MNTCVTGTWTFTKRIPRNLYQDFSHLSTTRPGTTLLQRPAESDTFKVAWPKTDSNPSDQINGPGEDNSVEGRTELGYSYTQMGTHFNSPTTCLPTDPWDTTSHRRIHTSILSINQSGHHAVKFQSSFRPNTSQAAEIQNDKTATPDPAKDFGAQSGTHTRWWCHTTWIPALGR